jgi:predicted dehydrogenase
MHETAGGAGRDGFGLIGSGRIGRRIATRLGSRADAPPLAAALVRPAHADAARAAVPGAAVFTDAGDFLSRPTAGR